eukprot:1158713-Pelagomonas_calceolata.AAC.1
MGRTRECSKGRIAKVVLAARKTQSNFSGMRHRKDCRHESLSVSRQPKFAVDVVAHEGHCHCTAGTCLISLLHDLPRDS